MQYYNPDLVVLEVPSSNDGNFDWPLAEHAEKIKELMDKIEAMDIPVLVILPHRFTDQYIDRSTTSDAITKTAQFLPENIKNYKALTYAKGFGLIDIFSKSIDMWGTDKVIPQPPELLDAGHMAPLGNKMWVDEIKKVFLIEDFE